MSAGVQRNRRAGGASAKEIHRPALAHQPHCRLPGLRFADGLNDDIEDRAGRNRSHQAALLADIQHQLRPEALGRLQPLLAPAGHGHAAAQVPGQRDKHQADRARPNHQHPLPRLQARVFDSLHHAGQRFDQRRIAEIGLRLKPQQVLLDQPRRDDD